MARKLKTLADPDLTLTAEDAAHLEALQARLSPTRNWAWLAFKLRYVCDLLRGWKSVDQPRHDYDKPALTIKDQAEVALENVNWLHDIISEGREWTMKLWPKDDELARKAWELLTLADYEMHHCHLKAASLIEAGKFKHAVVVCRQSLRDACRGAGRGLQQLWPMLLWIDERYHSDGAPTRDFLGLRIIAAEMKVEIEGLSACFGRKQKAWQLFHTLFQARQTGVAPSELFSAIWAGCARQENNLHQQKSIADEVLKAIYIEIAVDDQTGNWRLANMAGGPSAGPPPPY